MCSYARTMVQLGWWQSPGPGQCTSIAAVLTHVVAPWSRRRTSASPPRRETRCCWCDTRSSSITGPRPSCRRHPGLGIEVRAGLHTGECEVRGHDIGGIAVHIGARVSALAGPNEVLVSGTLRDLVIGSGLEFENRGAHQLKGVPGEWHLFAVTST
jgi:hypothetical protein